MQTTYTQRKSHAALANVGSRVVAFALDVLLLLTLVGLTDLLTVSSNEQALFLKPEKLLFLPLAWLYFAGTETCLCQGTLGKYLLHLRVTGLEGERIGFRTATWRFLLRPFSILLIVLRFLTGAGYSTRRHLHDRLTGTQVIAQEV